MKRAFATRSIASSPSANGNRRKMAAANGPRLEYDRSVFINCPFDPAYQPLFAAIIFTIQYSGFFARSALEVSDGTRTRLATLCELIAGCRYGIHDLSRTSLDLTHGLPRMNMPFELGLFLGCQRYGSPRHQRKASLILDSAPYRYQKFLSDIAGQDSLAHGDDPKTVIVQVRNWLRTAAKLAHLAGGEAMWAEFQLFQRDLPAIAQVLQLTPAELTFVDYRHIIGVWQQQRDPSRTLERL